MNIQKEGTRLHPARIATSPSPQPTWKKPQKEEMTTQKSITPKLLMAKKTWWSTFNISCSQKKKSVLQTFMCFKQYSQLHEPHNSSRKSPFGVCFSTASFQVPQQDSHMFIFENQLYSYQTSLQPQAVVVLFDDLSTKMLTEYLWDFCRFPEIDF